MPFLYWCTLKTSIKRWVMEGLWCACQCLIPAAGTRIFFSLRQCLASVRSFLMLPSDLFFPSGERKALDLKSSFGGESGWYCSLLRSLSYEPTASGVGGCEFCRSCHTGGLGDELGDSLFWTGKFIAYVLELCFRPLSGICVLRAEKLVMTLVIVTTANGPRIWC